MKLVKQGIRKPLYPWVGKLFQCEECGTIVQMEEADAERVLNHGPDHRDGSYWIEMDCDTDRRTTKWYEVKEVESGHPGNIAVSFERVTRGRGVHTDPDGRDSQIPPNRGPRLP